MTEQSIQTCHLARLFSLRNTIRNRKKSGQAVDDLNNKLEALVRESSRQTLLYAQKLTGIELQPDLPITAEAERIRQLLRENQVLVVAGETGCGKTTQLPKICMQLGLGARGQIAHTQPRRVAATSVAKRIADELNSPLGEMVGYSVRFNAQVKADTRLVLMTDGILLAEIESDPLLSRYEVIIIDEAHERSLNIDFLLGFMKPVLAKRKELKLIITSATIETEKFSRHFNHAPIVTIEGRSYPVEVRYRPLDESLTEVSDDPLMDAISQAVAECMASSSGDILIFADGEGQIKSINKRLKDDKLGQCEIMPLYARLSIGEQQRIFASSGKRKIIVSTNVAETSLTVPGIIFVIDIGNARISRFSQRNKIQQLPVEKVSKASAEQRKGRCGRIANGICIRLYSEEDFLNREQYTSPEIQRTNLASVLLKLKAMNVNNIEAFPFLEPPSERAWKIAENTLFELGALDSRQALTEIGKQMAKLPVDPQLARILVQKDLLARREMLVICALMSVREVRERPHDRQQKADQMHQVYHRDDSDILTALALWQALKEQKEKLSSNAFKKWCKDHLINFLGWLEWRKVYAQLKSVMVAEGYSINQQPALAEDVHKGLVPGFITHVMTKTNEVFYQGVRGLKIWLHPSSLSFKKKTPWLLSAEMIETEKLYARMNGAVKPEWLVELVPHLLKNHYFDIHWSKKSSQVVASLNQTLLGLPVVNSQRVNYSQVDASVCREYFLKEGLASDQLGMTFPFLQANRDKLNSLQEQEQKQRLNNICIDRDSLAALYADLLPEHVVSGSSLKKWLKKDFKARNQLLSFSIEQLTLNQVKSVDDYPGEIEVKGVKLAVNYCFAPGSEDDGISVDIPANMVKQFVERDFDWLVPGFLEDKILQTLKSLPKAIRKQLFPLNETAAKCYQVLVKQSQSGRLFVDELAHYLQRLISSKVSPNDFAMADLPAHLKMKYRVMGIAGQASSRLFLSLATASLQSSERKAPTGVKAEAKKHYQSWSFDSFEIEKILHNKGIESRIFQALVDKGRHVEVGEFANADKALEQHFQGMARLILLEKSSVFSQFFNAWPDRKQLEKLMLRFDGFRALFDDLLLLWTIGLLKKQAGQSIVFCQDYFQSMQNLVDTQFRPVMADWLKRILPLLAQREAIFIKLSGLNQKAYPESVNDVKQQLMLLWQSSSLLSFADQPETLFEDYARYQSAILARIQRIETNYPKEQQALEAWCDWHDWWLELSKKPHLSLVEAEFHQLFWLLQEFRISLFSPGVKVKGSVSAKKLQKAFDVLEDRLASS